MITISDIELAINTNDLDRLVDQAAFERNCELSSSMTYAESADFIESEKYSNDSMLDLLEILRTAENKWFSLENNHPTI